MKREWLGCAAICLLPACASRHPPAASVTPPAAKVTTAAIRPADSSHFYYELGGLYERHQDSKLAAESFARAVESAQNPDEALAAELGLARIDEARGDTDGAIALLEKALAGKRRTTGALLGPMSGDDLVERLGRLYASKARYADAERLYERALDGESSPSRRESFLRAEVALYRSAGTLERKIEERESTLDDKTADERSLRFLAIAYGGGELAAPMPATPGAPQPSLDKLARVYERLRELQPDDPRTRAALIALYERLQRIDDALALVRTAPVPSMNASAACPGLLMPRSPTGAVAAAAETVRLLARAGRRELALSETARLIARARDEGVLALLVGAQLYAEQNQPALAWAALDKGLKAARTTDDKRAVELAQAELLGRSGHSGELRALYAKWQRSSDVCLLAEATRRESMLAALPRLTPSSAMP